MFENIRARVGQAAAPWGARFEAFLLGMTPRDRKLFYGLSSTVVVALVGAVVLGMLAVLEGLEEDLAQGQQTLVLVQALGVEYAEAGVKAEELEAKLKVYADTDLSAFLEKAASSAQIRGNLDSVRETSKSQQGILEIKNYSVTVKKAGLEQVLNFLYETEGTGYPLRIQSANLKNVRVSGEKKLTLKLDVAAYRLVEEESG
jgi:type II secretory pathway component PulM